MSDFGPSSSMKFCWLVLCLLVPVALPAHSTNAPAPAAQADPFGDPLIRQIAERHRQAVAGDKEETKKLAADLEKWTAQQPANHLLQAYLGSVYTLCSRDAWPGPGKLDYLRRGGQLLDARGAGRSGKPGRPLRPRHRLFRAARHLRQAAGGPRRFSNPPPSSRRPDEDRLHPEPRDGPGDLLLRRAQPQAGRDRAAGEGSLAEGSPARRRPHRWA